MTVNALTKNTKHLLKSLYMSGVHHFVVSPGSRSTPVALLLGELARNNKDVALYVDVDERSAGFFALGIAKTLREPVVLLGTSGTAITEYAPAAAEASISHVPLIILSTDRPAELQSNGAPQTLPQQNIFGSLTKKSVTFSLQDEHPDMTEYIDFMIQKMVHEIMIVPRGTMQVNLPLRKPLMPQLDNQVPINVTPLVFDNYSSDFPVMRLDQSRVLILAGPNEGEDYQDILSQFARINHIPVIADVLSRARSKTTIYGIDALLNAGLVTEAYQPDLVIRFGATPVSARVLQWLKIENIPVWHVDSHAGTDHSRHVSRAIAVTPAIFLKQVVVTNDFEFYQLWKNLNRVPRRITGEISVPYELDQVVASDQQIFVANSMAIRDMDDVFTGIKTQKIYANRGANGIDGVISTALGMSATTTQRSVLLVGDLTLFHDMNGLMMAKQYSLPLDIIVINNNGGGIFSFLPQSHADEYFETLFGTPLTLNISKIADLYDIPYVQLEDRNDLVTVLSTEVVGARLIEFKADRVKNVVDHQQFMGVTHE